MQCVNLTDDELWRVIVQNTDAMSVLFQEHRELDAWIDAGSDTRADLMRFHLGTATKLLREYHAYTAELRRRYPWPREGTSGENANHQDVAHV
jgi:hypothetical protein